MSNSKKKVTGKEYEPLDQVGKNFRINWYRCLISTEKLKSLAKRNDLSGWMQSLGHLAVLAVTAFITHYFFSRQMWVGFAISLWVHGTIYSFIPGLVTHELDQGTVFKTKWLNWFFLRLYSLLAG